MGPRQTLACEEVERAVVDVPRSETIAALNVALFCALAELPRITAASAAISSNGRAFLILTLCPPAP